jgi:hypothetical protein
MSQQKQRNLPSFGLEVKQMIARHHAKNDGLGSRPILHSLTAGKPSILEG